MRNRLRFILAGNEVNPVNRGTFSVNFSAGDYTQEGEFLFFPNVRLEQNVLQLAGDDAQLVRQWYQSGRIWQGIPLVVLDQETELAIFAENEACLDLSDQGTVIEDDQVSVPIVDQRQLFAQQAEALSYRLLRERGIITQSDFVRVNYVINEVPDYQKAASIALAVYILTKEVAQNVKDTATAISNAGHFVVTSQVISVVQIALQVAYTVIMVIQIINLLRQLGEALFQPARFWLGMKVKRLLEIGCEQLGLTLETSLLDGQMEKLTLLPDQQERGILVGRSGNSLDGTPRMTFADLLRDICQMFNARAKVSKGKLLVERWDSLLTPSGVVLKDIRDSVNRPFGVSTNAAELSANIFLTFRRDASDDNTYAENRYAAQLHSSQPNVDNPRFNALKGVKRVEIPYSLANRKDSQSALERAFSTLYDIVASLFSGGALLGRRIGCMQVSQDALDSPRLLLVEPDGMVSAQDRQELNARRMIDGYHFINSARNNQQEITQGPVPVPLETQELLALLENPVAVDSEGWQVVVAENSYDPKTELYNLTLRKFRKYAPGITDTITD